jgi:GT2 family glycosyltransferase
LSRCHVAPQLLYVWVLDPPEQASTWNPVWFIETFESFINQTVPLWQLVICVPAEHASEVRRTISQYWAAQTQQAKGLRNASHTSNVPFASEHLPTIAQLKEKVIVKTCRVSHPVKILTSIAKRMQVSWLAVVTGYDQLLNDATYTLLKTSLTGPTPNVVYANHEYGATTRQAPLVCFKPNFCVDLLRSQNYIGSFFAVRRQALLQLGAVGASFSLAWAHDLLLRLCEQPVRMPAQTIVHSPNVLYRYRHRSVSPQTRVQRLEQSAQAVRNHFCRKRLTVNTKLYQRRVLKNEWPVPHPQPKVSLIIPTRDGYKILKECVDSILARTRYKNFEILIIDNQSRDPKTLRYLAQIVKNDRRVSVLPYDKPFNYSAINNLAVQECAGELVGFINNDVEVLNAEWLTEMVSHAVRPQVGAVGALLYYPDMTVQHGGVIVGMHGVADHAFKGADPKSAKDDPFAMLRSVRSADAVTAAVMLVRKENFTAVGGFDDQHLKVAFNDVDFCLKLRLRDLQIIYTPHAKLIHHESKSRRSDVSVKSQQTELYEHAIMKSRWGTDGIYPQQRANRYL